MYIELNQTNLILREKFSGSFKTRNYQNCNRNKAHTFIEFHSPAFNSTIN